MRLFDINPLVEQIRTAIDAGEEPNQDAVNLLIHEGPKAIEDWVSAMEEVEGEAETISAHIAKMQTRLEARRKTLDRMKTVLTGILDNSFEGKVKTPLVTVWNQDTTSYNVEVDREKCPQFFEAEYKLKKKDVVAIWKEERKLPDGASISEVVTRKVRIKH